MKNITLFYATREGHTRRIVEHVAAALRARGFVADVLNVAELPEGGEPVGMDAAIVAASIHVGKHEPEMVDFVRRRREMLERVPSAFLSVSMAEAGVEDESAPLGKRMESIHEVVGYIDAFFEETGWRARRVRPVAGALLYTQYGFFKRLLIKMIAKHKGQSTDTAHDHVYTDWHALDTFVDELARSLGESRDEPPAEQAA
jgi:menaquinone-dependent protoporphyrinogen oxidase